MDVMLLRSFQRQVELQCAFIIKADEELKSAIEQRNVHNIFYSIQNLLNAGANISKALWGQKGRNHEQRKLLRESIGILDSSSLKEVSMRNNFEHIDERLDRWWSESKDHNYTDMNIGPKDMISGVDQFDMFRHYDPKTTDLTFWGESFNINSIVSEVKLIFPKVRCEANKPHWK